MSSAFGNVFDGLSVLVTGHTGFMGSWLSIWLNELGAKVIGYSLDPPTSPSNFQVSRLTERITDVRGDVRDFETLRQAIENYQPQVVFHLAANSLVLKSFDEPKETFDTNVGGTVNTIESIRTTKFVKALICITSDKCYENREWIWGYRENDPLGGEDDPYSTSKAMAELAIALYRQSFFPPDRHNEHKVAIASVRSGNAIGGGDFADFRLIPDCIRALMTREPIPVRNPLSVRPWQHVLEPLSGCLLLAVKLLHDGDKFAEAWNFGPLEHRGITAQSVAEKAIELWGSGSWVHDYRNGAKTETRVLRLNWDKAANRLNWRPIYTWQEALTETVSWFRAYQQSTNMYEVCANHIWEYTERARALNVEWAG